MSDAGDAVAGVGVKIAGRSATTNAKGVAKIVLGPFRRKARLGATATKSGYVAGNARVKVR